MCGLFFLYIFIYLLFNFFFFWIFYIDILLIYYYYFIFHFNLINSLILRRVLILLLSQILLGKIFPIGISSWLMASWSMSCHTWIQWLNDFIKHNYNLLFIHVIYMIAWPAQRAHAQFILRTHFCEFSCSISKLLTQFMTYKYSLLISFALIYISSFNSLMKSVLLKFTKMKTKTDLINLT